MGWIIRSAHQGDCRNVLQGIRRLLAELRNVEEVTLPAESEQAYQYVIEHPGEGAVWIAEASSLPDSIAGLITVSIVNSIHVGGKYTLIQELWVHPDFRSSGIGEQLIKRVEHYCEDNGTANLEVCTPKKSFVNFAKTLSFYMNNGFEELGPRLKKRVELT
ncbi:GNAT family N-acetyltransferase [Paenibacillus sp. sgz500958]|uniref:GNAT family N-acetyltransferase n=1 Tax=Paenibacillus sp. sgz500958 TaxID=3242475 RepID=UPI0036D223EA